MTLRLVATPLEAKPRLPAPRAAALDPALLDAFVPAPGTGGVLARLRQPGALAVTTGQQPGLFTGPLYTVYKALSAAALARVLERRWDRPVVPLFWVAGDDHDYAEASRTAWLADDGSVVEGSLPPRPPDAPMTPLYREPLGDAIEPVLDLLASSLPPAEFREPTLDWLRRHYRPDATFGESFGGALAALLAPAGVACFDSTHPAAKRSAAPWLTRALERAADLTSDGATLVMLEGRLGRDRLLVDGDAFLTRRGQERFDLEALRRIAAEAPERLSPNVLLRPVIESALLPTVAYVAGPSELRYLEEAAPVYRTLDVPRQLPMPRWSGVLVEPRVARVLEKFGITVEDLLAPGGSLEARLVREQLPAEADAALQELRAAIEAGYGAIGRAAAAIDPTLTRPVESTERQALAGLQDIEKKLVQHLKRRRETELGQLAKARAAVFPNDKPQERALTIASFLARYGPSLVTILAEELERWYADALEGSPGISVRV